MRLIKLEQAILDHKGKFLCEQIHNPTETKVVEFRHKVTPPQIGKTVPSLPGLVDFYDTFGSITFYLDDKSGDAAVYIACPSEWTDLQLDFSNWIDDLNDEERTELLPEWIDGVLVIGEEPYTGNYLLLPTKGNQAGSVFLFDHDGFAFSKQASTLVQYAERLLDLTDHTLAMIATHMRFAEGDRMVQWWIRELRDTRGNIIRTKE